MKVLLRSDVRGVGRRGDIVEVKSGYARNFLLPSGAAMKASSNTESQASSMRKSETLATPRVEKRPKRSVRSSKHRVSASPLGASANGRLFGSVSEADVVNALRTATGISHRSSRHSHDRAPERSWCSDRDRRAVRRRRRHYQGRDHRQVVHEFLKYTHAETFVSACAA